MTREPGATDSTLTTRRQLGDLFRTSFDSLTSHVPPSCFSRMSQSGYLEGISLPYMALYEDWVTQSKDRSSSLRKTLARATRGRGCLYSLWLTPAAVTGDHGPNGSECAQQVANWPSPRMEDSENCGNHPGAVDSLNGATANWPTPMMQDSEMAGSDQAGLKMLPNATKSWPTPAARDEKCPNLLPYSERGGGDKGEQLPNSILKWATPTTCDMRKHHHPHSGGGSADLAHDAVTFPSTPPDGTTTALGLLLRVWTPPACRRLNPAMQWWLMGWPGPHLIFSGSAATEWTRWWRLLRSAYCGMNRSL